jgi:uncharacterized RDD family membrane protein YckC
MTTAAPFAYASLLRRYQALVTDGVVYFVVGLVALFGPSMLELSARSTRSLLVAFILFLLLYEPVLVAIRGGTLGHFRYGIRVVSASSGQRLGLPRALGRGFLKGLLGVLSLVFMLVTRRAQSLHDLAFGSVVVLAQPAGASELDTIAPYEAPTAGMPSGIRRVAVILAYSMVTFLIMSAASGLTASPECLDTNRCTAIEKLVLDAIGVVWVAMTGVFIVAGWRGRLLGCRRRLPLEGQVAA